MANSLISQQCQSLNSKPRSQDAAIHCCFLILRELSAAEGCHTRSDAILRLATAAEEIDTIVATLHNARQETSPPPNDGERTSQGET
jgi:hypothetical protein